MRKIIFLLTLSFLFAQGIYSQKNSTKMVTGRVCNGRAIYLPQPEFSDLIKNNVAPTNSVYVRVLIDKEGNVRSAKAQTGSPLLFKQAEDTALKAKFHITKLSGEPVEIRCGIVYQVYLDETFNPKALSSGIINGMGVNLVKPGYPVACRSAICNGKVFIQVVFDTYTQKTESAVVVSGHPLFRKVSAEAVLKSNFATILGHFNSKDGKIVGFVVYNFGSIESDNENPMSLEALLFFEAYKKMDRKILPLSAYSLDPKMWANLENSPLVNYGNVDVEIESEDNLNMAELKTIGLLNIKRTDNKIFGKIDVRKLADLASLNEVIKISQINNQESSPKGRIVVGNFNSNAIRIVKPIYPPEAKKLNINGKVSVEILIDEKGNVESAKAISGHPLLRSESVIAAKKSKFYPTKSSGKVVKVKRVIVYNFN